MKVTIDHPASSYGVPVIIDDDGNPMDYAAGVKEIRRRLDLTAAELAAKLGVSTRTVNGWEIGRMPKTAALNMLGKLMRER